MQILCGGLREMAAVGAKVLFDDATAGDVEAQYSLGCSLADEVESAAGWFFLAARQGHDKSGQRLSQLADRNVAAAQFFVAHLYEKGGDAGFLRSKRKAELYFERAARQGYPPAIEYLNRCYPPKQSPQALRKLFFSLQWKPGLCANSTEWELEQVTLMRIQAYLIPRLVDEGARALNNGEMDRAYSCLHEAAMMGNIYSQSQLSQLLLNLNRNEEAFYWAQRAAESGKPVTLVNLGLCYEEGRGTPQDLEKAKECYRKAANQSHPLAMYLLATLTIKDDREAALRLLEEARELGSREAAIALENIARGLIV